MEIKESKSSRCIGFRVSEDLRRQLEAQVEGTSMSIHDWCRDVVVKRLEREGGLSKSHRLIYEELARVRYLVGHGFRLLLAGNDGTAEAWEDARITAEQKASEIADQLLTKSRTNNQS